MAKIGTSVVFGCQIPRYQTRMSQTQPLGAR